nr:unnamed protein product [Callosobruchus analis]
MDKYGPRVIRPEGPLPAHILGNIWAQDWSNIPDIVLPYAEFRNFDVTGRNIEARIHTLADVSNGGRILYVFGLKIDATRILERVNVRTTKWQKGADKAMHRSYMRNLITVHHEMAHIEYYMYYADLPYLYRDGANPGFHEGVANAIILSVFNPVHFRRVGLFENNTDLYELNINFLMLMALRKVAYAPLLTSNQGIVPPVPRTEYHLDAASKRHIPADVPYTKYYVALLLEFQIHEAMCRAARFEGPLHECDVYRSREAGRVLM